MFDSHISTGQDGRLFCGSGGLYRPTRVFPTRQRFEAGIGVLLDSVDAGECAVLYVAVQGAATPVCRRMLNLAGNTLRVCMRGGAVAYLGEAQFAVLLEDTDAADAESYCRTVITIVSGFRTLSRGEMLSAEACIGGVLAGHSRDGAALLSDAQAAVKPARTWPVPKFHLVRSRDEEIGPRDAETGAPKYAA